MSGRTSLRLKRHLSGDHASVPCVSVYELTHDNGRTTLDMGIKLTQAWGETTAELVSGASDHQANLPMQAKAIKGGHAEALDKLADWLERAALAIRQRGKPAATVPDFPAPVARRPRSVKPKPLKGDAP